MKRNIFHPTHNHGAYTLIEVTLVIAILLGLISVLFLGVAAYKEGSDRANCVQQHSTVQKAVRSFANLYALRPGETITNFKDQIIGPGKFIIVDPTCPGSGTYTYGGDTIPAPGTVYLSCSIGPHAPVNSSSW